MPTAPHAVLAPPPIEVLRTGCRPVAHGQCDEDSDDFGWSEETDQYRGYRSLDARKWMMMKMGFSKVDAKAFIKRHVC
jgi:hypothetical protein